MIVRQCLTCIHFHFQEGEPTCHEPNNALVEHGTTWAYTPPSSAHTCQHHQDRTTRHLNAAD